MTSAFKICAVLSLASISFGVSVLQAKEIGHAPDIKLAPHRAIYDMKLLRSQPGSNISSLDGFLSIEFTGSVCEGFVQSTQLVTSTVDWNGREVLTDMRSSSWEDGTGEKFHFRSKRFVNQQESEVIEGDAARDAKKKSIQIAMKSPAYNRLKIGGGAMFPTQHSIAVRCWKPPIAASLRCRPIFTMGWTRVKSFIRPQLLLENQSVTGRAIYRQSRTPKF